MRSSTCSTDPMWVKVPRPISAARVIRNVLGAEPMPTMNTRERPRMAAMVSSSCCSLPISPSVRNTTWRRKLASLSRGSVSAAFMGGTISVPPLACSAATNARACATYSAFAGTVSVNSTSIVLSKRITLKRSVGRSRREREVEARLGLHHRGAAHGAGVVDHEDDLARARLLGVHHHRRRHEGEQIVGVADAFAEQADRRRGAGGGLPGQLEVAVGRHRAVVELDEPDVLAGVLELDRVVVALDLAEREAGLQAHRNRHRIDRRMRARVEHRRLDAGAVGHRIVDLAPAEPVGPEVDGLHDRCGIVARRHDQRHAQREHVARLAHRLLVFDLHQHALARSDIGDGAGEDVGPLLFEQRSPCGRTLSPARR